jgi:hypothetical protein
MHDGLAPREGDAMSKELSIVGAAVLALGAGGVTPAYAHFILLKPDSWLNEDQSAFAGGAPQKAGPCGPGGGDDVQPVPTSGKVTTVHVGDVVSVQWQTTVPHLGYFRISLAENRDDLVDPRFDDPVQCSYDMASVPSGAHDNVLMDGIEYSATMQDITIPDMPCDKCTLQVIQVMKSHGPPNCIYYHCADLKILASDRGGGMNGKDGGAASAPTGSKKSSSGCTVLEPTATGSRIALGFVVGCGALAVQRRRRRHA